MCGMLGDRIEIAMFFLLFLVSYSPSPFQDMNIPNLVEVKAVPTTQLPPARRM